MSTSRKSLRDASSAGGLHALDVTCAFLSCSSSRLTNDLDFVFVCLARGATLMLPPHEFDTQRPNNRWQVAQSRRDLLQDRKKVSCIEYRAVKSVYEPPKNFTLLLRTGRSLLAMQL